MKVNIYVWTPREESSRDEFSFKSQVALLGCPVHDLLCDMVRI